MLSMAFAAKRRHKFVAAAALAAAMLVPGVTVVTAAAPAAQAAVSAARRHQQQWRKLGGKRGLELGRGKHATGCWYYYGGTSCAQGYDCSGLVMEAFGHGAGIWLPHSTYAMLERPAPAPDPAVAGPAWRPDVLRLGARGDRHGLVPRDVRGARSGSACRLGHLGAVLGSLRPRTGSTDARV